MAKKNRGGDHIIKKKSDYKKEREEYKALRNQAAEELVKERKELQQRVLAAAPAKGVCCYAFFNTQQIAKYL